MKILLILLALVFVSYLFVFNTRPSNSIFYEYQAEWNKRYESPEVEQFRMTIFLENVAKIEEHNATPGITHTEGINQFTDLTPEEFFNIYLGEFSIESEQEKYYQGSGNFGDIDWVAKGAVSLIKDQGACGSCWAFGAVGSLESLNFLYGSKQMELFSEQMLVDCAGPYGCSGCNGGLRDKAFNFVIAKGLKHAAEYPYTARDDKCKFETGEFKIKSYGSVKAGACDDLAEALMHQPPTVGVDASRWSAYKGGIFDSCGTSINHGVLLVALSVQKDKDQYWTIKNSWGPKWGEKGFIRLKYPGSTCAVCNRAYYPKFD